MKEKKTYSIEQFLIDLMMFESLVMDERKKMFENGEHEMMGWNTGKMWMLNCLRDWVREQVGKEGKG